MDKMMNIDFDGLLELSKIEANGEERDVMQKELLQFVDFLGLVKESVIDDANEDDFDMVNVFRSDEAVRGSFTVEEMLSNSKTKADGYITVPRVVGEENG